MAEQEHKDEQLEAKFKILFGMVFESYLHTAAIQATLLDKGLVKAEDVAVRAEKLKQLPAWKSLLGEAVAPPGLLDEILRRYTGTVQ